MCLVPAAAWGTTISFNSLTDNTTGGGEINGTEFVSQGLSLTLEGGSLQFNVGCGTGSACLGADAGSPNDFSGTIRVTFVVPNTTNQTTVSNLTVDFCCEGNLGSTNTQVFDAANNLLASFVDTDVNYAGSGAAYFITTFGFDAMYTISFDNMTGAPAPAPLALLALGLIGIGMARRRKA